MCPGARHETRARRARSRSATTLLEYFDADVSGRDFAQRANDNDRYVLTAHPGKSQGRPSMIPRNRSARPTQSLYQTDPTSSRIASCRYAEISALGIVATLLARFRAAVYRMELVTMPDEHVVPEQAPGLGLLSPRSRHLLTLEFGDREDFDDPRLEWRRLFSGCVSSSPPTRCGGSVARCSTQSVRLGRSASRLTPRSSSRL